MQAIPPGLFPWTRSRSVRERRCSRRVTDAQLALCYPQNCRAQACRHATHPLSAPAVTRLINSASLLRTRYHTAKLQRTSVFATMNRISQSLPGCDEHCVTHCHPNNPRFVNSPSALLWHTPLASLRTSMIWCFHF